jgi:hypothetical protein
MGLFLHKNLDFPSPFRIFHNMNSDLNIDEILVEFINKLLKEQGQDTTKGNKKYHCPKCKHHKQKLEINFNKNSKKFGFYKCWVCGFKSKNLFFLLKYLRVSPYIESEFKRIFNPKNINSFRVDKILDKPKIELPKEFKPFYSTKPTKINNKYFNYIIKRGVTYGDTIKYNIGFCDYGEYSQNIIFPSYDNNGDLNGFIGRNILENSYIKYKKPEGMNDIIFWESTINWELPLCLCEGPFDGISIKRNVIPLLGDHITQNLYIKILKSPNKDIIMLLDPDIIQKRTIKFCEDLIYEGKNIYLPITEGDNDPNNLGFEKVRNIIINKTQLTEQDIFNFKCKYKT